MEHRGAFALGGGGKLQIDLEQPIRPGAGAHLDADLHLRRLGPHVQGIRRMRVLEGQVADELGQDADARPLAGVGQPAWGQSAWIDIAHVCWPGLAAPGRRPGFFKKPRS